MQRYFVEAQDREKIVFSKEQYHRICHVMRMTVGDQFFVVLANGQAGLVEISNMSGEQIDVNWLQDEDLDKELPVAVTLAMGLPKGDKLDLIVQKGTELGATAFLPFDSDYAVVKWDDKKKGKKQERLQKIASQAAQQSQRTQEPDVLNLVSFKGLLEACASYDQVLIAYEEEAKQAEVSTFKAVVSQLKAGESLLVVFGSEGGLSPKEVEALKAEGAKACGLGPRIMRAETAPLYVLSAISYEMELN